jgi:uridine kinase
MMKDIEITLLDKKIIVPFGTRPLEILEQLHEDAGLIAAVIGNNEILPLTMPLEVNSTLKPMFLNSHAGQVVYRQTLSFILCVAVNELMNENVFPKEQLVVGHSLGYSFYFYFRSGDVPTREHLLALENRMNKIVIANRPITFHYLSYTEADKLFRDSGRLETADLLLQRNKSRVSVYTCGDFTDLHHSTLLSRTGFLENFKITPYKDGLLLRFPATGSGAKLGDFNTESKIFSVYKEYKSWGSIEGVHSASMLNDCIREGKKIRDFIRIAEAFHSKKLSLIAEAVYEKKETVRAVMLAGPSSSGKTTSAKRLSIELEVLGFKPITVSLDDYYLAPEFAPKGIDGKPDLEALEALDVPYLNRQLVELLDGREVTLPVYDFKTSKRLDGRKIRLSPENILILEGIHGLNDKLTPQIDPKFKFKLYVSALTQLNIDDHNRVPTSDNRLLRRIVRDSQFRGLSALRSLQIWPSVRRGEEKNIFPFQEGADAIFNSALDYELSVLKFYAEPRLREVNPDTPEYAEAVRLLTFLENFAPIPPQYVPPLSILREFIGESEFKY